MCVDPKRTVPIPIPIPILHLSSGGSIQQQTPDLEETIKPAAIASECATFVIQAKDIEEVLKTTVTEATYTEGYLGGPMENCIYATTSRRVGGTSQDLRLVSIRVVADTSLWTDTDIAAKWKGSADGSIGDAVLKSTGDSVPSVVFLKSDRMVEVSFMAEVGTAQLHESAAQLAEIAAARL
ncbi:hypothetical protein O7626_03285 [Micromonospora sp. WMMD1102]|uniref:hypothetical protein n=1 Tax=Micromonospora sp. WMMD1102 TaxID=3016105 RepID=UPI002415718A|nr:hypothetical protein [Micromonospora sp. WMMD1102]MDG4784965.1 hypothetical protein [Micromonospora sp. WMMD1102]